MFKNTFLKTRKYLTVDLECSSNKYVIFRKVMLWHCGCLVLFFLTDFLNTFVFIDFILISEWAGVAGTIEKVVIEYR